MQFLFGVSMLLVNLRRFSRSSSDSLSFELNLLWHLEYSSSTRPNLFATV